MDIQRYLVGGEFELRDLYLGSLDRLSNLTRGLAGTWALSGRTAFGIVLRQLRTAGISHIHLPSYLCQSLLQPVRQMGFEFSFYPLDPHLEALPDPPANAAVLLIHYFGWINPASAVLREGRGSSFHLVEDASQALLSDWSSGSTVEQYVFLSLRKFGPVPLGGWCNINGELGEPSWKAEALAWRSVVARLVRGTYLATPEGAIDEAVETSYLVGLREVERFLDEEQDSAAVPRIALEVAAGQNWESVAQRRCQNWQILNEMLGKRIEPLFDSLPTGTVPLGYVVRLPINIRDRVRDNLALERIFCPIHWSLPPEVTRGCFPEAVQLAHTCLTLPVDQRYGAAEMDQISKVIRTTC